jgi:hypothetical protein
MRSSGCSIVVGIAACMMFLFVLIEVELGSKKTIVNAQEFEDSKI